MDINKSKDLTITVTEEEACAIVFAVQRLTHEREHIKKSVYSQDALFDSAKRVEAGIVEALESPFNT